MVENFMRSTEQSGVGATGFGAGKDSSGNTSEEGASRPPFYVPPIAAAVAATAFLAAALFTAYDAYRTFDDQRRHLELIGSALAQEIIELDPQSALTRLDHSAGRFAPIVQASLVSDSTSAASPFGQMLPVGGLGAIKLEPAQNDAAAGVMQRGAGAFAIAALMSFAALRRRPNGDPDPALKQSYRTLAAAIPMGVACWTRTGELIVCNQQYRDSIDMEDREVTYHQAVKRLIAGGYMKLLREGDNGRLLELHREDGSCLLIDERPLGSDGFMTLVSDITEAKKTDTLLHAIREEQRHLARRYHEEKLKAEAASRAKTNFLAHLSHDIRTPLNHIIGFADLMRHETYGELGDKRYLEYVQSIKSSGEHLLASFASILELAELESGQKGLRSDPLLVDDLIEGVAQRFRTQAQRAGVGIVIGAPTQAIVAGDKLGLTRMLGNLVENAIRFTPTGGRITLAAFAAPDGVVLEVTDTGIGMSEERLQSLSQPFALGDATFTREGGGPGLGISIARAIAELSGGHLAIDSSPALGTTVAISLPLAAMDERMAA
jgi:two-component system cell cycle sensor histidine kinase PleC